MFFFLGVLALLPPAITGFFFGLLGFSLVNWVFFLAFLGSVGFYWV